MRRSSQTGRAVAAAAVVAGVSSVAGFSTAADPPADAGRRSGADQAEAPAAKEVTLVTTTAKIDKIDKSDRTLTLKDDLGHTLEVKAGPDVDLDRLHAGDPVKATYYEEVAVAIRKHAEGGPKVAATAVMRGGVTAQQATVTARIVSVDRDKNTIEIQGANGKKHTLKVDDPDLKARLATIRPGDNMDVTYTQAVALSIEAKK